MCELEVDGLAEDVLNRAECQRTPLELAGPEVTDTTCLPFVCPATETAFNQVSLNIWSAHLPAVDGRQSRDCRQDNVSRREGAGQAVLQ